MEPDDDIDLEGMSLLDSDSIPNENQSLNCFSCEEPMTGLYCAACGQKNDNFRRSVWSLGAELLISVTAYDGRIWRSLRSLIIKPGRMAREFADGARQKWTSPVRLYLAMSLMLFGYIALSQTQLVAFGTKLSPTTNSAIQFGSGDARYTPEVYFLERKSTIQKTLTDDAISAFEKNMADIMTDDDEKTKEELQEDLDRAQESLDRLDDQLEKNTNSYAKAGINAGRAPMIERIASLEKQIADFDESEKTEASDGEDVAEVKPEDSDSDINITGADGKTVSLSGEDIRRGMSLALRQPERLNAPINKWLPRIMFLMMPFSMLMGAIFIRGRDQAMLYDHLVHAAYIHAFSFLLLFVFVLLVQFTPIKGLLFIYTTILLVYLPLSAKRMFGRGWFKTFLTSYGVGAVYTFIMMIVLLSLIISGVLDIAGEVSTTSPS